MAAPEINEDESPIKWRVALTLVLMLAVGGTLRWSQIHESLWLDELHTSWVVSGGIDELVSRALLGNQSPLYFLLPWLSQQLWGIGEWQLRLPSFLAGMGLIAATWALIRRTVHSEIAAALGGFLVAVDHHCIFYAQEARPYAWVQLVGAWHIVSIHRLCLQATWRNRAAVIVSAALLFWLHYTAALLFVATLVWYSVQLLHNAERPSYRKQQLALDGFIVLLLLLPATPHLLMIAEYRENWEQFITQRPLWIAVRWFSLLIYLGIPAGVWLVVRWSRSPATERLPQFRTGNSMLMLSACWLFFPVLAAWLLTVIDAARLFFPRYMIVAAAGAIVCGSILVGRLSGPTLRGAVALGLVGLSVATGGILTQFQRDGRFLAERQQDWRGAVAYLNDQADISQAPLLLRSGLIEADALSLNNSPSLEHYCQFPVRGIYAVPPATRVYSLRTTDSGRLDPALVAEITKHGSAWFLISGSSATRGHVIRTLGNTIESTGPRVDILERQPFSGIEVVHVEVINP